MNPQHRDDVRAHAIEIQKRSANNDQIQKIEQ